MGTPNDLEEDDGNSDLHRPPPARSPAPYLCMVVCIPAVILLGIGIALTIWLIALKSNNNDAIPTAPPSLEDSFWFDTSSSLGNDDDMALGSPTRNTPTQNPTIFETPQPSPNVPSPTFSPTIQPPTQSPTLLPTQESIFIKNARGKFLDILESRTESSIFAFNEDGQQKSPQVKAQNWLSQDPQFHQYSDDRMIQRWVLATFAFGMMEGTSNGDNAFLSQQEVLQIPPALQDWVQYTDECTWFHTIGDDNGSSVCNSEGLYIRLDLRSQNLVGTLPSEIALLSNHLLYLHLYDNQIKGTMPTELGLLSKLERLELTNNTFDGSLPTELGSLDKIEFLGLGVNNFSGPLPSEMGNLSRLNTIGLEWNQFTSEIPPELGNLRKTRILNMDRNDLSGYVPQTLGQMIHLREFNLSFNSGLIGNIPDAICQHDMEVLQADCHNVDCPCCTKCNFLPFDG